MLEATLEEQLESKQYIERHIRWRDECPIRTYRNSRGISLRMFALSAGLYWATVQEWEWGSDPNTANMDKLADAMGLTPEELRTAWSNWKATVPLPTAPLTTRILRDSLAS